MRTTIRLTLFTVLVLAAATTTARAQIASKFDARARLALAGLRTGATPRALRERLEPVTESGTLDVFITGDVTRAELEAAGVLVRTAFAGLYTAFVPVAVADALAALSGVETVQGAAMLERQLDVSVPWTNADLLREGSGGVPGPDGDGVIIGIVDSGIDAEHAGFRDATNHSRVLSTWDQTVPANSPPVRFGYNYGSECSGDHPGCGQDVNGHGSHVAGIAAGDGDGNAGPTPWVGMAPAAHLVVVKTTFVLTSERYNMTSTGVVDAVAYVFRVAGEQPAPMPAVVNLSLGTQYGPHDGSSPLERMLDSLSGPGRIIVVSAGNDRDKSVHAELGGARGFDAVLHVVGGTINGSAVAVSGYYPAGDNYDVTITGPNGVPPIGPLALGAQTPPLPGIRTQNLPGQSSGWVYAENGVFSTRCGARQVYLELSTQWFGEDLSGDWTLHFTPHVSNSDIDLWMSYQILSSPGGSATFTTGVENGQHLVSEPANARRVITVASWRSRSDWRDCNGGIVDRGGTLGHVSSFSSPGPTRDGRQKPDIAAPGEFIVSAWSRWVPSTSCTVLMSPQWPNRYAVDAGTSMAAPHVTGAVALLQQEFGRLSPECAKFFLTRTAVFDLDPEFWWMNLPGWTKDWGWGRMDLGPLFAPGGLGALPTDLLQDTFTANETYGLPQYPAQFDTTSALVKTGFNTAQTTSNAQRRDVPADSMLAIAGGDNVRVDLVFRIKPGPGNYVVVGDRASGLRPVPTNATATTPSDGSFWSVYRDLPGDFASVLGATLHDGAPSHWDPNVWNSARMDTAELNLFPLGGCAIADPGPHFGLWSATYHEADQHFASLGFLKHRCFVVDTTRGATGLNVTCDQTPPWISMLPASRTGYNGDPQTREYTKIIPDGLLTPGSHVEYFFRKFDIAQGVVTMCPDTTRVFPQTCVASQDGERWEQFSVLPDRWKGSEFGGPGMACMLYVDLADGSGIERVWTGVADSIGATQPARFGAGTGWHAVGGGADINLASNNLRADGSVGFTSAHLGQQGMTWDRYNVRGASRLFGHAGALGSRLSWRGGPSLTTGKESRQGPTPEMLRTFYRLVMMHTSDRDNSILGPFADRSQDDVALLRDFATTPQGTAMPRGLMIEGSGFVEAANEQGPPQSTFCSEILAVDLRNSSYPWLAGIGDPSSAQDLLVDNLVNPGPNVFGVSNPTPVDWPNHTTYSAVGNDVLVPVAAIGGVAASWYENVGINGPYVASVYKPRGGAHNWTALTDGWNPRRQVGRLGGTSHGRLAYYYWALNSIFGNICTLTGPPYSTLDVDRGPAAQRPRDYLQVRTSNPLRSGSVRLGFGSSRPGRVVIAVHDIAGREVRRLVDENLDAGAHECAWDGLAGDGGRAGDGMYFVRLRRDGYEVTRKVVMLAR